MAWQTEMIPLVRIFIGDVDSENYAYSDERITTAIVSAAYMVVQEATFSSNYAISFGGLSIQPDPTELSPPDYDFINLVSLKAAILIYTGELRKYALSSVSITDGPSSISMANVYSNIKNTLALLTTQYGQIRAVFQCGQIGQAVITPTTVSYIYPIQDFS